MLSRCQRLYHRLVRIAVVTITEIRAASHYVILFQVAKKAVPLSVALMIEDAMSGYEEEMEEVESPPLYLSSTPEEPATSTHLGQEPEVEELYLREGSTGGPA